MSTYQLYKKEHISITLEVGRASFLTEKYQLVAQGFERIGEQVNANCQRGALTHIKQTHLDSLKEFVLAHSVQAVVMVISAMVAIVHYGAFG